MNFIDGNTFKIGQEKITNIVESRNRYIIALKNLFAELQVYKDKGEVIEEKIKEMAIRSSITEWAMNVQISQYFQNIYK